MYKICASNELNYKSSFNIIKPEFINVANFKRFRARKIYQVIDERIEKQGRLFVVNNLIWCSWLSQKVPNRCTQFAFSHEIESTDFVKVFNSVAKETTLISS